jgi:hypothetical protein
MINVQAHWIYWQGRGQHGTYRVCGLFDRQHQRFELKAQKRQFGVFWVTTRIELHPGIQELSVAADALVKRFQTQCVEPERSDSGEIK